MVLKAARNTSHIPYQGLANHKQAHTLSWPQISPRKPRKARCSESTGASSRQPRPGGQNLLQKTECGVWLLACQKPINRLGWWKGKFLYFRSGNWDGEKLADNCPKAGSTHSQQAGGQNFYRQNGVGLQVETAQLSLTVIFELVTSGLTSVILVALGTVNLQFWCPFIPISLQPVLGCVAAHVLGTVWSSCS